MKKEFIKICEENSVVGATCLVTKDNEIKEIVNYGYSNLDKGISISENTVFRIASISKLLVATCIMQLVEKGKLDLDEDVSKYLGFKLRNPKFPDKIIDLKMIMTQTSSISDGYEAGVNSTFDSGYNRLNGTSEKVCIEDILLPDGKYYVEETFNEYEPGTHYEYSNFGCGILACIIERVENKYFFDYFKENVSERLGIKASFMASDMDCDNITCTYSNGKLYRSNETFFNTSVYKRELGNNFIGPAGGLYISLLDLNKVMNCYLNDGLNLLKKETMDRMLQLTWYGDRSGDYAAKGLQFLILDYFDNRRLYGHFGYAYNVRSFLLFNPIQKMGMICFINGADYKMQDCGMTVVQEAMIKCILDEYWDDSVKYELNFEFASDTAYLNNRKIKIEYDNNYKVGRFISVKSMLDMFSISTWPGKSELDKLMEGKPFLDITCQDWTDYYYDLKVKEIYTDNSYNRHTSKQEYYYEYSKKKAFRGFDSKLRANYHTHCCYCNHASGNIIDYVSKAKKLGFEELGMSDHGPIPADFVNKKLRNNNGFVSGRMDYDTFINQYLKEIEEANERFEKEIKVLKSVELEYFSGHDEYYQEIRKNVDYLLLGQHYLMLDGKCLDAYFDINHNNIFDYSNELIKALDTKLFDIIAHPDIFMYHYISENGKLREADSKVKKVFRDIIEACIRNNVYIEFNLGGLYRGIRINDECSDDNLYTRLDFWRLVSEYKDAKVLIGCDAHSPNGLNFNHIMKAKKILSDLNITFIEKK